MCYFLFVHYVLVLEYDLGGVLLDEVVNACEGHAQLRECFHEGYSMD